MKQPIYEGPLSYLKAAHLREPIAETPDESIERLTKEFVARRIDKGAAKRKAIEIVSATHFKPMLIDPPPGKTGIVRDRTLRYVIRKCLSARGLDPDQFTVQNLKEVIDRDGPLCQASGVPIKSAVLLWANSDPIVIPRKRWDQATSKMVPDMDPADPTKPNPRTVRLYDGQSNHHMEIREGVKGRWSGKVVRTFDAAQMNIKRLQAIRKAGVPSSKKLRKMPSEERGKFTQTVADICRQFPIVDRVGSLDGRFVMSLAEGEMIYARRWDSKTKQVVGSPEYFVVCKLDKPARVHFAPHWDARKASEQDRWDVVPDDLKHCGPVPGKPPTKVRVTPLGEVVELQND